MTRCENRIKFVENNLKKRRMTERLFFIIISKVFNELLVKYVFNNINK